MNPTQSDHRWHRVYEAASPELGDLICDAYSAVSRFIRTESTPVNGEFMKVSGDDRAECLVAAITRFVCESNPNHPAIIAALEAAEKEDAT